MPENKYTTRFELKATDRTKGAMRSAMSGMKQLDGIAGKLALSLGGLAGVGGLGLIVKQQAEAARSVSAYSNALGVSVENMSRFQFAAESVNIENEKMSDILKDVSEKIADAYANNAGEAAEALENLNLNAAEMNRLSPDQQLLAIANALNNVGTQGEKVQILESLASDASLLLPLLDENAKELKRLSDLADETGRTFTPEEVEQLREADEAFRNIGAAAEGLKQTLAVELSGVLTTIINKLNVGIPAALDSLQESINEQAEEGGLFAELLFGGPGILGAIEDPEVRAQQKAAAERYQQNWRNDLVESRRPAVIEVEEGTPSATAAQLRAIERLRLQMASEEQVLFEGMTAKMEILAIGRQTNEIGEREHMDLMFEIQSEYEDKITTLMQKGMSDREKFQRMSFKNQSKTVLTELANMTAGIAQHSRTAFELNKAAGIANALISAHEGANKSLAKYPWPLGGIMAGLSWTAGIAHVDAIRSTSFSGGGTGTTPSAAGSVPTINDQAVEPVPSSGGPTPIEMVVRVVGDGAFADAVYESIEVMGDNDALPANVTFIKD